MAGPACYDQDLNYVGVDPNMLTGEEVSFVVEYLKDFNVHNAGKRLGFDDKKSISMYNKSRIRNEIDIRRSLSVAASGVTKEYLLTALREIVEEKGSATVEAPSAAAKVSAIDKMAKMIGAYVKIEGEPVSKKTSSSDILRQAAERAQALSAKNVKFAPKVAEKEEVVDTSYAELKEQEEAINDATL